MLREVVNQHIAPRIIPFKITTAATPAVTVNTGYGDVTATRTDVGQGVISLVFPFRRNGLIFGCQGNTAGGYFVRNSATGNGADFAYRILDEGGNLQEGEAQGFLFGWNGADTDITKFQRVQASFGAPRIIHCQVTGSDGSLSYGSTDFTITRTATGTYSVVFGRSFSLVPIIMATPIEATNAAGANVTSVTAEGCTITFADDSATLADTDFYLMAMGSDAQADTHLEHTPLLNSQRFPRIVAAEVTNTGGTWTQSIGDNDFGDITDNGAGDFSMTMSVPFRRVGSVFATNSTGLRAQVRTAMDANGVIRIVTKSAVGTNTDANGVTSILCIGSDDPSEY